MSCDNSLPLDEITQQVRDALAEDFVQSDRPIVTDGVFTNSTFKAPSIRGDILFDSAARVALIQAIGGRVFDPPSITGSRTDGTALENLLSTLESQGIITDDTTT